MQSTEKKLIWSEQLIVRWSDLDANGHVNSAVFFTYCEQSRIDWMQSVVGQTTPDGSWYGCIARPASRIPCRISSGHSCRAEPRHGSRPQLLAPEFRALTPEIRSRSAGETNGLGARQQKGLDTRAGSL